MSSLSTVLKHLPGKHDQKSHGIRKQGIPANAIKGVDLTTNYTRLIDSIKSETEKQLEEYKSYFPDKYANISVPTEPAKEDVDYVNNTMLYHRTKQSYLVANTGLQPSSITGHSEGSRWYDEHLGRTEAIFLKPGKAITSSVNYGSSVYGISIANLAKLIGKNTLAGLDIGDYPAEGNGPGFKAYKKDLLSLNDYVKYAAYERTLERFKEESILGRPYRDATYRKSKTYEIMVFGSIPAKYLTVVK